MIPIPTLERLVAEARSVGPLRLAVAAAESDTALGAAALARRQRIADVVLVGDRDGICRRLAALGEDPALFAVEPAASDADAARRAVAMVRGGEAAILMKGRLQTADLLRAILDRTGGLRDGRLLSDVLVADHPLSPEPRLLGITDGGVNVAPTLAQKREIALNAVALFRSLGHDRPRVACLCAVEGVTDAMPHTRDAAALAAMNADGELPGCLVSGPLALDNALSVEAAREKGIDHPVAGRADVLLVPTIETGNALGKAFTYLAHRHVAHVIVGARAPVLIPSRVERAEDKLYSIALGAVAAARGSR
ncbi:phosphate acyltransferase [Anaeromyxobacter oryzae]|uniref:Phosphate butyryltransferase n=1 Tax=Anaeromyxobacter oryzae TaxID=2918170 RepID=A0ABM7WVN3_9BACT|nr:phosphate acyltransferase [Anaeromyxobacter oryzae]BDG03561.1 phosphate butyryltransferase [Anaeromyxobacter oryzae]